MIPNRLIVLVVALVAIPVQSTHAQQVPGGSTEQQRVITFASFVSYLDTVRAASIEDYRGKPNTKVESAPAFEDMRAHVLHMYDGAAVVSSFVLDESYVDCIRIESQPSVRELGIKQIAKPPLGSTSGVKVDVKAPGGLRYADSPLKHGLKDRFGNAISCPDGTIPMARITLDKLVRYRTLSDFLAKTPRERRGVHVKGGESEFLPDWDPTHLHAYGYQYVNSYGGNSWLNLWNPAGDFSLSQHWYIGGSGSSTQTVEGGWQVLADKYNTNKAALFIYWTADDYQQTGCYNLDCAGFVQVSNSWYLGGTWSDYSSDGGTQWGFELQWKLYSGNWWLLLKGPGDYEAVGYYPTSIYNGGQLSKLATLIEYGGETTRKTGDSWPQMGSGASANQGWQHAAFQNTIFYIPRDENGGVGVWSELTGMAEGLATCYSINVIPAASGGSWGSNFFYGGPGSSTCN